MDIGGYGKRKAGKGNREDAGGIWPQMMALYFHSFPPTSLSLRKRNFARRIIHIQPLPQAICLLHPLCCLLYVSIGGFGDWRGLFGKEEAGLGAVGVADCGRKVSRAGGKGVGGDGAL